MNKCIYCNNEKLYVLKNNYLKCSKCKKKFSLIKYNRQLALIECFSQNLNALQTAKKLKCNYITVGKRFFLYRELIVSFLDNVYKSIKRNKYEFDEYIYLKNKNIKTAQNFLTFNYENHIYNIMLPSLNKFSESNAEELSTFLKYNKIAQLKSSNSLINDFWDFLENFLKKYKGIKEENFIYYLKECEFKFNYDKKTQEEILLKLLA